MQKEKNLRSPRSKAPQSKTSHYVFAFYLADIMKMYFIVIVVKELNSLLA